METRMEVAMAQSIWSNRKTAQQSLRAAAEDLAGEIATLSTLEPAALLQKWKALFGTDPSPLLARIFMVRAIAYRLQEQRYGGLKPLESDSRMSRFAASPTARGAYSGMARKRDNI
jgi:Protein of unknown function (DUF2924)